MAPKSLHPPELELHSSEVAKPQPLRIIKRSKTISGSSASGETFYGGRRSSSSSSETRGGSPLEAYRSLTVHKIRTERGRIPGQSQEHEGEMNISNFVARQDQDTTPKAAHQTPRTMSAGMFLREQYHGDRIVEDDGPHSVTDGLHARHQDPLAYQKLPKAINDRAPKATERRLSRSKNIILRAFGGNRDSGTPSQIRRTTSTTSTTSKNTLLRRLSRARNRSSCSYDSSFESNIPASEARWSFDAPSYDNADTEDNSIISSFDDQNFHPPDSSNVQRPRNHGRVLFPEILVTPEQISIDGDACDIWVGIQISGVLRNPQNHRDSPQDREGMTLQPLDTDLGAYGKLHSMRIDLHPGQGCTVLEIIGNLHESKMVRVGCIEVILAKIRFPRINNQTNTKRNSSEELFADLQNHLGESLCSYLTVRLTYKHSAFPDRKTRKKPDDGMQSCITRIETEATAVIKRRNAESAWSPRTSQTINCPIRENPLHGLIERSFVPTKARDILMKISDKTTSCPITKRSGRPIEDTSGEPLKVIPGSSNIAGKPESTPSLQTDYLSNTFHRPAPQPPSFFRSHTGTSLDNIDETDPARKIWTEMRLTSRGGRYRVGRTSISADHYFSLEEETTPIRNSSGNNSVLMNTSSKTAPGSIDHERSCIMEVALRNQRSVGTETLRSIAPSVARSVVKPKGGTVSGIGLRTWGWGPPWW